MQEIWELRTVLDALGGESSREVGRAGSYALQGCQ